MVGLGKRCGGWWFLALALLASARVHGEEPAVAVAPKDGVIKLLDGKSLEGFYTYLKDTKYEDPRQVFRVTDGMLHITGDGLGSIITKQEYRDYHLVLEFKWGPRTWGAREAKARDSGLLIHSQGADGGYGETWMPSIEVQIIEGGMGDFIMVAGNDKEGKPVPMSLTCEAARDRDGEVIWKEGGQRETFDLSNRKRINWFGRDPTGPTRSTSAARRMWTAPWANGPAWTCCAMAATSRSSSTA
jgi:hypothetical protein